MIPINTVKHKLTNQEITQYEKSIPDLYHLYSDLKDRYIKLKIDFIVQRREARLLRTENIKLLRRAVDAEEA